MLAALGAALLTTGPAPSRADAATDAEIAQLLDFVAASGCEMVRNGTAHSSDEARAHLEKKLAYLRERDRIGSADDFIERAASGSSLSGRPYVVRCAGSPERTSADWLRAELSRLRDATGPLEEMP
jgi:hypothetical protein